MIVALKDLTAVVFDLDGTVGDTFAAHAATGRELFRRRHDQLKPECRDTLGGELTDEVLREHYYGPSGEQVLDYFTGDRTAIRREAGELFSANRGLVQVYPGFLQVLKVIKDRKLTTGIITDADTREAQVVLEVARALPLCREFGLEDFLARMPIVGSEGRSPKPATEALYRFQDLIRERLGQPWLYVGDEPVDVEFSIAAGAKSDYVGNAPLNELRPDFELPLDPLARALDENR